MEKIDIVVPWVDGSDERWVEERNSISDHKIKKSQYRDWGLLKYWFRMVEENAPWVNKIYFVTWGHIPSFLNTDHPKLVVVKHEDFIPSEYLPTFSANVIETNIHRIKGLSEKFIYFNDDVYITKRTEPEDFFVNGIPCDSAITKPIVPARYDTISNMMINNIGIINEHFSKRKSVKNNISKWFNFKYGVLNLLNLVFLPWSQFIGLYEQHSANSFLKSTFDEVWELEYEHLNNTGKNKVRNFKTDVNQWVFKNWRIAKGEFVPRKISFSKYVMIKSEKDIELIEDPILNDKYKILCVNDHVNGTNEDLDKITKRIRAVFENRYSKKSEFEN